MARPKTAGYAPRVPPLHTPVIQTMQSGSGASSSKKQKGSYPPAPPSSPVVAPPPPATPGPPSLPPSSGKETKGSTSPGGIVLPSTPPPGQAMPVTIPTGTPGFLSLPTTQASVRSVAPSVPPVIPRGANPATLPPTQQTTPTAPRAPVTPYQGPMWDQRSRPWDVIPGQQGFRDPKTQGTTPGEHLVRTAPPPSYGGGGYGGGGAGTSEEAPTSEGYPWNEYGGGGYGGDSGSAPSGPTIPPIPSAAAAPINWLAQLTQRAPGQIFKLTPALQQYLQQHGSYSAFVELLNRMGFHGIGVQGELGMETDFVVPGTLAMGPDALAYLAGLSADQSAALSTVLEQVLGLPTSHAVTAPINTVPPPSPVATPINTISPAPVPAPPILTPGPTLPERTPPPPIPIPPTGR